jgi:predicted Zn finger-like uncharacterized protein
VQMEKVLLRENGKALLRCPHCETSKEVKAERIGNRRKLKVRCTCKSVFEVFFESRKTERKDTYLEGFYAKLPGSREWGRMLAKNISLDGLGFVSISTPNVKRGDRIRITLSPDNASYSDTDKNAIVRFVKDKYVGCEFTDRVRFDDGWAFSLLT